MSPDLIVALLAAPEGAMEVPAREAAALLARLAGLEAVLRARLTASPAPPAASLENSHETGNRLLSAEEVALRLGLDVAAVTRRRFPFRVKLGRRTVRYSEAGLRRWIRSGGIP